MKLDEGIQAESKFLVGLSTPRVVLPAGAQIMTTGGAVIQMQEGPTPAGTGGESPSKTRPLRLQRSAIRLLCQRPTSGFPHHVRYPFGGTSGHVDTSGCRKT